MKNPKSQNPNPKKIPTPRSNLLGQKHYGGQELQGNTKHQISIRELRQER
jgi:hypothetical protein